VPGPSFLLLILLSAFLLAIVQVQVLTIAFEKLGLSPGAASFVLIAALLGSLVNIPLFSLRSRTTEPPPELPFGDRLWQRSRLLRPGRTLIAVNVGGCIVPLLLSYHFWRLHTVPTDRLLLATALVTALSYALARPVPGLGIAMPALVPPFAAVLLAVVLDPAHAAHLAFISGTVGVLLGADVLHLPDIRDLGPPIASIGGAGTFDGIFLTGILAALLA